MKQLNSFEMKDMALIASHPLSYMFQSAIQYRKGLLLADTVDNPSTMVFQLGNKVFVGGRPTGEALRKIEELGQNIAPDPMYFFYPDHEWHNAFMTTQISEKGSGWTRCLYEIKSDEFAKPEQRPEVVRITEEMMQSNVGNKEMIYEEVSTYSDFSAFLNQGIGFALVIGNEIKGFCTSEYQSDGKIAIGIEVDGALQRQGYAKCMTQNFLYEARRRRYQIYWECWEDNYASNQTALSCGFEKLAEYPIIEVNL